MGDGDGPERTGDGTRLESREDAERVLAALEADYGRREWEFAFDRHGWYAWRSRPFKDDLKAPGPAALRRLVEAVTPS